MTYPELVWHTKKLSDKLTQENEARNRAQAKAMQRSEAKAQQMRRVRM